MMRPSYLRSVSLLWSGTARSSFTNHCKLRLSPDLVPRCHLLARCCSHSSDVPPDETTSNQNKDTSQQTPPDGSEETYGVHDVRHQILEASLQFVPTYGWSNEAISNGAESLGYSSMAHGMFNEGGVELVNHFNTCCNNRLEEILKQYSQEQEKNPNEHRSTTKFIKYGIKERLLMNADLIDTWPNAMAINASPTNAKNALHNIGTIVDHIWYYAGDRSNDFNWYTKRWIVAVVYKSCELCMVQDKSLEYKDTWNFLDRRLEDVKAAAKIIKDANNYTADISNLAQAGVITALNILGMKKKSTK